MVYNTAHIAEGSVVRQLRILASQFCVLRTGTRSEIRPSGGRQMYSVVSRPRQAIQEN